MAKDTKFNLTIRINGKEVKNNLSGVKKEMYKLRAETDAATRGSDKYIKKSAELKKVTKLWKSMKQEITGVPSLLDNIKNKFGAVATIAGGIFAVDRIQSYFTTISTKVKEFQKLKHTIKQVTGLEGKMLESATSKVKALADAFDEDTKKMSESANALSKQMGIDFSVALDLIEQGFIDGADANGDFLDKVREYPALLQEAGLSAQESIALMTQEVKSGIYSDKGVDAIKEATLRLREMTPAATEALNSVGLSSKRIQEELTSGSKTTFDIIKEVSKRMAVLPPQSKLVGQAIADIFGGPGEDAGYKYLANLHQIDLSMDSNIGKTDKYTEAKRLEIEANEALNNVWVKLTDTGGVLNILYNKFKLGLVSILETITSTNDLTTEIENERLELVKLELKLNDVNTSNEDRVKLIDQLKEKYPTLLAHLDSEKTTNQELSIALKEVNNQLINKLILSKKDAEIEKQNNKTAETTLDFISQKDKVIQLSAKLVKDYNLKIKEGLNYEEQAIHLIAERRKQQQTTGGRLVDSATELSHQVNNLQVLQGKVNLETKKGNVLLTNKKKLLLDLNPDASIYPPPGGGNNAAEGDALKTLNILRESANELGIKNTIDYNAEQLKILITAAIKRKNTLAGLNKEKEDKKTADREKELEKQKTYQDKILLQKLSLLEQEVAAHKKKQKESGLLEIATLESKQKLTEKEQAKLKKLHSVKEVLEAQHIAKIAKIELEATNKHLEAKQKEFNSAKTQRSIVYNNELAGVTSLADAKLLLSKTYSDTELAKVDTLEKAKAVLKRTHEAEELEKKSEYFKKLISLYTTALNSGEIEGVSFADKILTEDQKVVLNEQLEQVRLKLSEVNAEKNGLSGGDTETGEKVDLSELNEYDIFGSNPEQWDTAFSNLDTLKGKTEAAGAVIGGLQQAWGMYSKFLAANEQKQLESLSKTNAAKKNSLDKQLESALKNENLTDKEKEELRAKHNDEINGLDREMAKKQAEIDYKRAKREKAQALFGIAANTALGITKAVAMSPMTGGMPWAAAIGAMGMINAAMVIASPMPDKTGFFYGGHTGDKAIAHDKFGKVTGAVHEDEWVGPKFMTENPKYAPVFQYLESERLSGLGQKYFEGGSASSTPTPEFNEALEKTGGSSDQVSNSLLIAINQLILQTGSPLKAVVIKDYEAYLLEQRTNQDYESIYQNTRQ